MALFATKFTFDANFFLPFFCPIGLDFVRRSPGVHGPHARTLIYV